MYNKHSSPRRGGSASRFSRPHSSAAPHSRPSRGGSGNFKRGGPSRGGNKRRFGQHIDVSRFINKAVITEQVEHFVPEHKFTDFNIDNRLKKNILDKGYELPTPIQDKIIPHVLRGADVVGIANTGTGKTAAFLIPLINKVILDPRSRVLVVVPTRELAIQIEDELRGFTPGLNIFGVCVVGGAPMGRQINALSRRHQFLIGTPGRLRDLIERKVINLSFYQSIVLDEADRMLDMGFINEVRFLVGLMPAVRHTLFFSATMSREIETLIGAFLKEPVRVSVKTGETSKQVDQDIVRIPAGQTKIEVLHDLLIKPGFDRVLIFGQTKFGVERLSRSLKERGFAAESIHGDKNHGQRQKALKLFKDSHAKILVATDVAARGLDISGVSHVINYDLPSTYDDYVHRIGRTGRAGAKGFALTFVE